MMKTTTDDSWDKIDLGNAVGVAREEREIHQEFEDLDKLMKMYFKQETIKFCWDARVEVTKAYNANRKWYQRKKPVPPSYREARLPDIFFGSIAQCYHPQYQQTKELIERYCKLVLKEITT